MTTNCCLRIGLEVLMRVSVFMIKTERRQSYVQKKIRRFLSGTRIILLHKRCIFQYHNTGIIIRKQNFQRSIRRCTSTTINSKSRNDWLQTVIAFFHPCYHQYRVIVKFHILQVFRNIDRSFMLFHKVQPLRSPPITGNIPTPSSKLPARYVNNNLWSYSIKRFKLQ